MVYQCPYTLLELHQLNSHGVDCGDRVVLPDGCLEPSQRLATNWSDRGAAAESDLDAMYQMFHQGEKCKKCKNPCLATVLPPPNIIALMFGGAKPLIHLSYSNFTNVWPRSK